MKRVIPAGRIAIAVWMAAALILAVAMTVCTSCGAQASSASVRCTPTGDS